MDLSLDALKGDLSSFQAGEHGGGGSPMGPLDPFMKMPP
jgi:hypothetical protein